MNGANGNPGSPGNSTNNATNANNSGTAAPNTWPGKAGNSGGTGGNPPTTNFSSVKVIPRSNYSTTIGTGSTNGQVNISWNRQ
jgi:hypothetical protein